MLQGQFRRAVGRLLHPNGPMVSAHQLLSGEVPVVVLRTRYIAVMAADEVLAPIVGNSAALFAAIELMESAGWELVSIARDQVAIYAYLRHPSRPPGQPAAPPGHTAG